MPSLRSYWVKTYFRLTNRVRKFETAQAHRDFIANDRPKAETPPPPSMLETFSVNVEQAGAQAIYTLTQKDPALAKKTHIIYLHGGAYTNVILPQHWDLLHSIGHETGCSFTVPLYGLAPEFGAEDAFALLIPLYRRLAEKHGASNLVLMGDSAGGGLALALAQRLKTENLPQPSRLVLFCPWLDIGLTDPAVKEIERVDVMLRIEGCREAGRLWAKGVDAKTPMVSPMFGDSRGLAPMSIFIGTHDLLLPDVRKYAAHLRELKQPFDYHEFPSMPHIWMVFNMPEAHEVVMLVKRELAR